MEQELYLKYVEKLKKELVPAMGCTEPIAIAYGAAKARAVLGCLPEKIRLEVSGNIVKNAKSVVVPNTEGRKGLETAVAIGTLFGDEEAELEVISKVTAEQAEQLEDFMKQVVIQTGVTQSDKVFEITIHMVAGDENVVLRIVDEHTNIIWIEKNGQCLYEKKEEKEDIGEEEDFLTISGIYEFAKNCKLKDVEDIIRRQIKYNYAIAKEGVENDWGANVGSTLLKYAHTDDIGARAKAMAVAGSDARMSGCEMPVIINSGSGNQGITVSVPVIEYAIALGKTEEELIRALVVSNLVGVHQKAGIGRLSAYCGAVSAGSAAGAGIAFLQGGDERQVSHVIVNCLAITSGIVCDGAKPSCAAKIAASLDAALLAYHMTLEEQQFRDGEGIVKKGVENTIKNVATLGRDGMKETDKEILRIMVGDCR